MSYLISLMKEIIKKRKLTLGLSKVDSKKHFVGSYFGIIWVFIQPIVIVLIYFFVSQMGFKSVPPVPGYPYVLWLIPGIVPWFYLSEVMNSGTNCLQEYNYLMKKVVFRVEILPIIKVMSCLMVHLIFVFIMLVVFLIYDRMPTFSWVRIVYYTFVASVFSLAVVYFTGAVNVFLKDMAWIVNVFPQFRMWLTPIMRDFITLLNSPAWLTMVLKINPVCYITIGYRDSTLTGDVLWQRPLLTVYFWVVIVLLFLCGLKVFRKLRPHFSDVL